MHFRLAPAQFYVPLYSHSPSRHLLFHVLRHFYGHRLPRSHILERCRQRCILSAMPVLLVENHESILNANRDLGRFGHRVWARLPRPEPLKLDAPAY